MKKKKLVKEALRNPELFSIGELAYFEMWLRDRKERKEKEKKKEKTASTPE
jgi:hypothetical protein